MTMFLIQNSFPKLLNKKLFRDRGPEVSCKKIVLRNFAKFTGKHLGQSLFFIKETDTYVFL